MTEDRPTLIYYVQTVLNSFKRDNYSADREYVIKMLSAAMEHQNDIWNDAIEEAANWLETTDRNNIDDAYEIRKLKK